MNKLITYILLITTILFITLYYNSCSSNKDNKDTYEQNEKAFKNKLTIETNKNNELQTSIVAFECKTKDLNAYNKQLEEEVKLIKKSKVKVITIIDVKYINDTITIDNTIDSLGNGNYKLNWAYTNIDSSRILAGESYFLFKKLQIFPGKTFINKDEIRISLVTGVKYNKKTGFNEIFVTSKTPNVYVSGLKGAILDKPKKKKISIVGGIGYGIGVGKDNRLILTPTISITIGKNLFSF